ncbi:MAG: fibronectin type III domain-containing protein [Bacteroidales bacterium]|nr:fibronectin type III domain-containing protein [Bacteroidales bacterium]
MKKFLPILFLTLLAACQPDDPVVPQEVQAPSGVKLVSATQTSLVFAWTEVDGADYYVARLETADGKLVPGGQTSPREASVGYDDLTPGTTYSFKVRTKAGEQDSPYSSPIAASTLEAGEEPVPGPGPDPTPTPTPSEYYEQFKIPVAEDQHGQTLAFPGAEGGGMYTTGGRGGKVIHVTTLADSGAGSLRAALAESGARTIVFDVAGLIDLKSQLNIAKGDVTIAGQTAPGDGICLKGFSTQMKASNVIIRFVRFRMGDENKQESDAIWGRYFQDIILDHCSMSWSVDECSSFYANSNFTMQWCILTESLCNSVHGKGSHGYGGIWGGKNASFHHNLLANHKSRNPRFDHPEVYDRYVETHRGHVDYRNNAVYNWGDNSTYGGEGAWFNMVGNYYKPGPASKDRKYFLDANGIYTSSKTDYGYPLLYLSGNVHTRHSDITSDNSAGVYWHDHKTNTPPDASKLLSSVQPLYGPSSEDVYTTTHTAETAFERILSYGGASLSRDVVDERACTDAKTGKATFADGGNGSRNGIIDTQAAVGGWPAYEASSAELDKVKDADGDGMPDWFEDQFGLKKSDASDGNAKTLDPYGRYTNLEMYLHYLVKDIIEAQNAGGTYQKIS